jgi:hypothetical protein
MDSSSRMMLGSKMEIEPDMSLMPKHESKSTTETAGSAPCASGECASGSAADTLNRTCYCVAVDQESLRRSLEREFGQSFSPAIWRDHAHLFASSPFFLEQVALQRMTAAVAAIEEVVRTRAFQDAALTWAPEIARFDPGPRGGVLGYDFHLTESGPRLIEINTNPGGAFLNAVLARFQRLCCRDEDGFAAAPVGSVVEQSLVEAFSAEWRLQRGSLPLRSVSIVDEAPERQYLYPEFLLVRELLRRQGIDATVCDASELVGRDGRVYRAETAIDLIYNRLTDFSLTMPRHAMLKAAYLAGEVVLTPHPRAHALYADKRNLTLLCDSQFLERSGASERAVAALQEIVPRTELVTAQNRELLWSRRRGLFFKPAAGYGSRAAYRGDKLTKRVWEEIALAPYVAQEIVLPSERRLGPASEQALKVDVRVYAYAGETKLVAARMYRGQTTNFRTPGGGFAPVLTRAA